MGCNELPEDQGKLPGTLPRSGNLAAAWQVLLILGRDILYSQQAPRNCEKPQG